MQRTGNYVCVFEGTVPDKEGHTVQVDLKVAAQSGPEGLQRGTTMLATAIVTFMHQAGMTNPLAASHFMAALMGECDKVNAAYAQGKVENVSREAVAQKLN